ncbi:MAG: hypothetical protein ABII79_14540 [bacterium]
MRHNSIYRSAFVLGGLVLICSGCGRWLSTRETESIRGGQYEIVWVDPQMVVSDSLFTLIRSDRIDSLPPDRSNSLLSTAAPSVVFHIAGQSCVTTVNLLDAARQLIKPLMVRRLNTGYYKFAVNWSHLSERYLPVTGFFLKVDFCDSSVVQPVKP